MVGAYDADVPKMLLVLLIAVTCLTSCDTERARLKVTDDLLTDTYRRVCDDAVKQYEIAKRNGSQLDTCVHAGFAAAAFLQAKDEAGYAQWKKTETADCAKAGLAK